MKLEQFLDKANQFFDDMVVNGTDDELFASGYFRGHFDLALAALEVDNIDFNIPALDSKINQSLEVAFKNGELVEADQALVNKMWANLKQES
ncbi:YfcL family protein [Flocculibacter collagenilyticus]|uniref:YfcL family protein n=1 Tax=Flocculibacter collagenilyticus TaxID=2744479 RepID=UPI0018F45A22|nr:YfcL family protein [Flocculibacter collagenilyticus]